MCPWQHVTVVTSQVESVTLVMCLSHSDPSSEQFARLFPQLSCHRAMSYSRYSLIIIAVVTTSPSLVTALQSCGWCDSIMQHISLASYKISSPKSITMTQTRTGVMTRKLTEGHKTWLLISNQNIQTRYCVIIHFGWPKCPHEPLPTF